eukprot:1150552-Pelagomonas_calceolata.AAC.3
MHATGCLPCSWTRVGAQRLEPSQEEPQTMFARASSWSLSTWMNTLHSSSTGAEGGGGGKELARWEDAANT